MGFRLTYITYIHLCFGKGLLCVYIFEGAVSLMQNKTKHSYRFGLLLLLRIKRTVYRYDRKQCFIKVYGKKD